MRIFVALILAVGFATVSSSGMAQTPATPAAPHTSWQDPVKLDDRGYIRQWLVLGPINYGAGYNAEDITKEQIKNEDKFVPKAGDKVSVASEEGKAGATKTTQKELTWKAVKSESSDFDLNKILAVEPTDGVGGYAVAYLDAPEEMKGIKFSLCSNDNCKVVLNGKKVHSFVGGRMLEEDADVVSDLTLQKGPNVVVFKIWNDSNDWSGCLRLLNKDGKPVTNVTTRLPK